MMVLNVGKDMLTILLGLVGMTKVMSFSLNEWQEKRYLGKVCKFLAVKKNDAEKCNL